MIDAAATKRMPDPRVRPPGTIPRVCLGLGSNIQPEHHLPQAVRLLRGLLNVVAVSRVWESPPVGMTGPHFLNAALLVQTSLPGPDLKMRILRPIEAALGRVRTFEKHAPRPIDIDLLVIDGEVLERDLWTLPFLAVPVAEFFPELKNPQTGETVGEAARRLAATGGLVERADVSLRV